MRKAKVRRWMSWFLVGSFSLLIILTFYMVGKQLVRYIKDYSPITSIYITPDSKKIYVSIRYHARTFLFFSEDQGENWNNITPDFFLHKQKKINDILFIFGKEDFPGFISLITQDSFFISNNFGKTWERIIYQDEIKVFLVRQNPFQPNEFLLASFDGIFFTSNYGTDLRHITEGFKHQDSESSFYIKDLEFSGTPGVIYFVSYDSLFKSSNAGFSWTKIPSSRRFYYQLEVDSKNKKHLFVGITNGGILETENSGYKWEYLDDRLPIAYKKNLRCFFLKINPYDSDLIFASVESEDDKPVNLRSLDGGETWERMELQEKFDPNTIMVFRERNEIYLGTASGKLFLSKDKGTTWRQLKFEIERLIK